MTHVTGHRIYGTGLTPLGVRRDPPNHVELTLWLSVLWVPIFPIRSMRAEYSGESSIPGVTDEAEHFQNAVRIPHDWDRIVSSCVKSYLLVFVGIAPASYLLWRTQGRAATTIEIVFVILSAAWPVGLIIWTEHVRRLILRSSNEHLPPQAPSKVTIREGTGLLIFFVTCGLTVVSSVQQWEIVSIPLVGLITIVVVGGGVGGFLMVPTCPRAGVIAGIVAGLSSYFAIDAFYSWKPDADIQMLGLVQCLACLPAIGLGYLLQRHWGQRPRIPER